MRSEGSDNLISLDALPAFIEGQIEPDGVTGAGHQFAVFFTHHNSATCRNDGICAHRCSPQLTAFHYSKRFLAFNSNDFMNTLACTTFDLVVEVDQMAQKILSKTAANGRLPACHKSDEKDWTTHMYFK